MGLVAAVGKLLAWWKLYRQDRYWDSYSIYVYLQYKLNSLNKMLLEAEPDRQDKKILQSLRIACKLVARLVENKYSTNAAKRLEKEFGVPEYWRTPVEDDLWRWHWQYPKAVFRKQKDLLKFKIHDGWDKLEKVKNRDRRNLFLILNKYIESYWD